MAEKQSVIIRVGAGAAAVAAILGLYLTVQSGVKEVVQESSAKLGLEIKQSARDLADVHRSDLHVRVRTLNREIEDLEGRSDTELNELDRLRLQRLKSQRDDLQHQIDEITEKWFTAP